MDNNQLSGSLPNRVQLPVLHQLNLANQVLLSGTIPASSLSAISGLRRHDLSDNKLSGTIPPELVKIRLEAFDLSNNALEGLVLPELASQLKSIVLSKKIKTVSNTNICIFVLIDN